MIKEDHKMLNKFQVLLDVCTIAAAYFLAYYLRYYSPFISVGLERFYPLKNYAVMLIYLIPLYLCFYYIFRLYAPMQEKRQLLAAVKVLFSNICVMIIFLFTLYLQREYDISRKFLFIFVTINVILSISTRMLSSYLLRTAKRRG